MSRSWSLKRGILHTLVVALVLSALIGIYAFLFGDFGETEVKILMTTLGISYFSVTSLSCATALEKRSRMWFAAIGLGLSVGGFLLFLPVVWAELFENEAVAKATVIVAVFCFSLAQICLLGLVPLRSSVQWVFYATTAVILGLATFISALMILERDDEWLMRLLGVLGILDGCGSLVIPVLFKLGGADAEGFDADGYRRIELTCPRCGHREIYAVGTIRCAECSLEMRVQIQGGGKKKDSGTPIP
jgi:hypothetical protein